MGTVVGLKVHNVNLKYFERELDIIIIIIIIIIYVAISGHKNVINKEVEKILKHKELIIDIQLMWNCESKVIPVLTAATGTTSESPIQYLSNVRGKHEIKELQKKPYLTMHTYTTISAHVKVQYRLHG
jgi:hypothetical protein